MTDGHEIVDPILPHLRTPGERQALLDEFIVDHDRFREAAEFIERFHHPVVGGRPGYGRLAILAGDSRAGKTFSVRRHFKSHPATIGESGKIFPVVFCEMPATNTELAILEVVAGALEIQLRGKKTAYLLERAILNDVVQRGVQLLIWDEIQDVFDCKRPQVVNFVRKFIRKILNPDDGRGPNILCVGLTSTYEIMRVDSQLTGRGGLSYKIIRPYEWDTREERLMFRYLCGEIDKALPFQERSGLERESLAERLYFVTKGNLGLLKDFIRNAGYLAINDGAQCIGEEHFARLYDMQKPPHCGGFNAFNDELSMAPKEPKSKNTVQRPLSPSDAMSKKRTRENGSAVVG